MLHHAHLDLTYDQSIMFGAHFLHSWASEEARFMGPQPDWVQSNNRMLGYQSETQPDGKMMVFGGEVKIDRPDLFGYLYLGASYITLKDAVTVAPAVEVIHSFGGGEFNMGVTSNYLDSDQCRWNLAGATCSNGNGNVLTVAGQYENKLSDLIGQTIGDGMDLTMKLYGMWHKVGSDDELNDGITKMKFGTDFLFDMFPVLALGTRFDYLAPNSRRTKQNFMILSPRLVFRSQLVTHEQITLQYSRYMYAQRECEGGPYTTPADIQASRNDADSIIPSVPSAAGAPPSTWVYGASEAEIDCVQPPPSAVTPDGWGANSENQGKLLRGSPVTGAYLRPDVNVISLEAGMWW